MTRYLVTGGAGFIGSHLTEALVKQEHQVAVLDNLSCGNQRNLAHEAFHPRLHGGFKQPCRAKHIDLGISVGIMHGPWHAPPGRQVDGTIDVGHGSLDDLPVKDVALDKLDLTGNSILDLLGHLNRIFGSTVLPRLSPNRRRDVRRTVADSSKAASVLNWKRSVNFDVGLRRTVEYFQADPPRIS